MFGFLLTMGFIFSFLWDRGFLQDQVGLDIEDSLLSVCMSWGLLLAYRVVAPN